MPAFHPASICLYKRVYGHPSTRTLTALPMDDSDLASLRARLAALEKEVRALRQELAGLRQQPPRVDQGPTPGLVTGEQAPYGLSIPAAQPDLPVASQPPKPAATPALRAKKSAAAKNSQPKRMTGSATKAQFEEAKAIIMEGYILDRPEDADRMLKTLIFRILDGSAKGFRSADLASARIAAMYLIEQAGLNPGPGFRASKLRSLLKRHVRFEPITSIRRLPR